MRPTPLSILTDVCKKHHTTPANVVDIPYCTGKTKQCRIDFARACHQAGWGYYHIAKTLKCSLSTAHRYGFYYEL